MSNLETILQVMKKIDMEVSIFFQNEIETSQSIDPKIKSILKDNKNVIAFGGKRLRGILMYLGYLMAGGKDFAEILKSAVGIELIHTWLLIHDDVMDKALVRRNCKTVHESEFEKLTGSVEDRRHKGISNAISLGDVLSQLGFIAFSSASFDANKKILALDLMYRNLADVGYGQILDVSGDIHSMEEEYVMKLHTYKTGFYTYETPLCVGAILAGAEPKGELIKALKKFSLNAGIAFQLVDDIIDVYGDPAKTGKAVGTDISEKKNTLLNLIAIKNSTSLQLDYLKSIFGKPNLSLEEVTRYKEILKQTGSIDYSIKKAKDLFQISEEAILEAEKLFDPTGQDLLLYTNQMMLNRLENEK